LIGLGRCAASGTASLVSFRRAPGAKERKDLSIRLEALRRFRNRLAHHDSILKQPVAQRFDQMIEVVSHIDAGAAGWVADASDVTTLLRERPGAA